VSCTQSSRLHGLVIDSRFQPSYKSQRRHATLTFQFPWSLIPRCQPLSRLLNALPEAIICLDHELRIVFLNQLALNLLQLAMPEASRQNWPGMFLFLAAS